MPASVKVEISKRVRESGADLAKVEQQLAPSIGKALAVSARERVEERADLAGQTAPDWDGERRGKLVSSRYPDTASGPETKSGAERFDSAKEYHRENNTRRGTYHTTGGMWGGVSTVVFTPTFVRNLFRGRSEGQDPRIIDGRSRPIKVSNALKAWTVLDKHGVNVLALSDQELAGVGVGVVHAAAGGVSVTLPVTWDGGDPPSGDLTAVLLEAINGRR